MVGSAELEWTAWLETFQGGGQKEGKQQEEK